MRLTVSVRLDPGETDAIPPLNSAVRIEVRDVSLADAPSRTVAAVDTTTTQPTADGVVARATLEVPADIDPRSQLTVFAQLAGPGAETSRGAELSRKLPGDWITTRAYPAPVTGDSAHVEVGLRPIR
jgi:hypothetical protein